MTVSASTLEKLMAAGITGDALLEIVRSIEVDQAKPEKVRSAGAIRQQRYRGRGGGCIPEELREMVFSRDGFACLDCGSEDYLQCDHAKPVSKGGETTLDNLQTLCRACNARKKDRERKFVRRNVRGTSTGHSAEKKSPPDPLKENTKKPPSGVKKRHMAFPSDWVCGEAECAYAAQSNFSDRQAKTMFERFRDHHISKGSTMADWPAAWRTWVRNELSFGRTTPEGVTPARADGWPLAWPRETCRTHFLAGSWPAGINSPAPGMPGCKIPDQIQREWLAEKANLASNAA